MSKLVELNSALAVSTGSLEAYTRSVFDVPVLSEQEEQELARRLKRDDDLEAAKKLILAHLRFVVHVARGYNGYGLSQADLIQEGNVGLMKAVKRFDPDFGVRLVSFAVHWIRAEIHEFILRNWRIVKVATTKAQRKLFFNLRSAKTRLGWFTQEEINAVAKDLGVSPEVVVEMEARMNNRDTSFDPLYDDDNDEKVNFSPSAYLTDGRHDPAVELEQHEWEQHKVESFRSALEGLDARSRDILQQRWLGEEKATLHQLADQYQVSAERIRQLEQAAIKKLKVAVISE